MCQRYKIPEKLMSTNPLLSEERALSTFSVRELSEFIYDGEEALKRRDEIADFVDSVKVFDEPKPVAFMSRKERYENVSRKTVAAAKEADKISLGDVGELAYYESLVMAGEAPPMSLHYSMFLPTIQGQMSDEQQEKWLTPALQRSIVGTYAQTEIGHGTNVRALETTATYIPESQEFEMNTPTLTATKWWPGNLGKSANYAVVIAQLITNGKKHGTHGFLVQIRDEHTHRTRPGIKLGDIGPKLGIMSNDNGFMHLNHVRIPRENMLMRNAKVLPSGEYVPPKNTKLGYGAMVFVRSIMIVHQAVHLAKGATIAIRYSAIRKQGEMIPGKGEVKLLDYQTQQYRLFPELSRAYCFYFAGKTMRDIYFKVTADIKSGETDMLPELHAISSGLKAVVSWGTAQGIEQSRLACGGHGYMHASGFPDLYGNTVGGCTYEGDNIVLLLQVARFLVKCGRKVASGITKLPGSAAYIGEVYGNRAVSALEQSLRAEDLVRAFEHVARRQILEGVEALDQMRSRGHSPEEAWNRCAVQLCKMARAHVHVYLVKSFVQTVAKARGESVRKVLNDLCMLFICTTLQEKSGQFLEDSYLSRQQLTYVKNIIPEILASLRPNAVALVDAFQFRDRELRSVLGRKDGWVYENLMEWVKHSDFNDKDVLDCHHKYMGPMMKEARSKL